jgi:carbon storage regulator
MLLLSRKIGEVIIVGEQVRITVLATRGSRVQLGIDAPAHVSIRRANVAPHCSSGEIESGEARTVAPRGVPPGATG